MAGARFWAARVGAVLALIWGTCTSADEFAERRATCEPILTVVKDSCQIENFYRCSQGDNYSETYWQGRLIGAELYDADYNPIYYAPSASENDIRRVLRTDRAYSLSEILRIGQTSGTYMVEWSTFLFIPRPAPMTLQARLTDETRTISGTAFQVAQSEMRWDMEGDRVWVGSGPLLIDAGRRLMINDEGVTSLDGIRTPTKDAVLRIIDRDMPGFMATSPPDCDTISSLGLRSRASSGAS